MKAEELFDKTIILIVMMLFFKLLQVFFGG